MSNLYVKREKTGFDIVNQIDYISDNLIDDVCIVMVVFTTEDNDMSISIGDTEVGILDEDGVFILKNRLWYSSNKFIIVDTYSNTTIIR